MAVLDEILAKISNARTSNSICTTVAGLARQVSAFNALIEEFLEEVNITLIDIINTGGGGGRPVFIIRARVNQLGGVPATQNIFPFDEPSLLYPVGGELPVLEPEDLFAHNVESRVFQDNEVVNLITFNGETWLADKLAETTIAALVDQEGGVEEGDQTFRFNNAIVLTGTGFPANGEGWAINATGSSFVDNESLVLVPMEDPTILALYGLQSAWVIIQDKDLGGGGGAGTAGFGIDDDEIAGGVVAIDKRVPTGFDDTQRQFAIQEFGTFKWGSGTKGWYRAVTPILKAITFQSGGSLYRATGYGDVVPYVLPESPPSPPIGLPFGFVYEASTDENDVIRAHSFYSADILPNSIVMCEEIDGILFVVTEDCV